jgi:hypothetical protein
MAWKVVGKGVLLYSVVQEKPHYTMMRRGTPTSAKPVKNCPARGKKSAGQPCFLLS